MALAFLTSTLDKDEWSASSLWPLYPPGKSPRYVMERRLCGPQSMSECCGLEKDILSLLGIEPRQSNP
jgi:hypothetical protein